MKVLGLIILFAVPSAFGFFKSQGYLNARDILHGFIGLINFIKREISSYLTPQQEIYNKFYDKTLDKIGFLSTLRETTGDTPLAQALMCTKDKLLLKDETFELLLEFALTFGTLCEKEEVSKCEKLIQDLEEIYKEQKEETREKTRLCRTAWCMIGLALVLLMW